jgi:hypothetical protein
MQRSIISSPSQYAGILDNIFIAFSIFHKSALKNQSIYYSFYGMARFLLWFCNKAKCHPKERFYQKKLRMGFSKHGFFRKVKT